jgi:hypothetical protein
MSVLVVMSLAVAIVQAPPDPETWLKAAREMPPATDAAAERALLERIATGFEMRNVRLATAPTHTGRLHESLSGLGAALSCHDVTARGSLVDIAYFVPAAARLLRPSVIESLEIVPVGDELAVTMRVAFPAMEVDGAHVKDAVRVLDLVREQPRPTTALLLLARHTRGRPLRITRVRHGETFELEALAVGVRAGDILTGALAQAGLRNARVARETSGGCAALRVTGVAAAATQEEEDAARADVSGIDVFVAPDAMPCVAERPAGASLSARRQGTNAAGIALRARDASRAETLAFLEMATGRPMIGAGPSAVRVSLDFAGVTADEAIAALRDAGAPLRPFAGMHLWTDAQGPFRIEEYTGQPVSLSLQCADLGDIFRIFGHVTGLEFHPAPDVVGCADVFATERPWDEVLEGLLAAAGLTRRIDGTKVFVAAAPGRPGAKASAPRWDVPLDHLTAAELRLTGLLRSEGQWRAFARGPLPGRLQLAAGTKLADGVVRAVDESGVTIAAGGREVRLTLP